MRRIIIVCAFVVAGVVAGCHGQTPTINPACLAGCAIEAAACATACCSGESCED